MASEIASVDRRTARTAGPDDSSAVPRRAETTPHARIAGKIVGPFMAGYSRAPEGGDARVHAPRASRLTRTILATGVTT